MGLPSDVQKPSHLNRRLLSFCSLVVSAEENKGKRNVDKVKFPYYLQLETESNLSLTKARPYENPFSNSHCSSFCPWALSLCFNETTILHQKRKKVKAVLFILIATTIFLRLLLSMNFYGGEKRKKFTHY